MTPTPPKPMLAAEIGNKLSKVRYPVLVQPKLDGVRALIRDGVAYSRTGKLIPNKRIQATLKAFATVGALPKGLVLDGELISGTVTDNDVWNKTSSAVMSKDATSGDVKFHCFDLWYDAEEKHPNANARLKKLAGLTLPPSLVKVPSTLVTNEAELLCAEEYYVSEGYEGVILRDPKGFYKNGRSTGNSGELLKFKRFHDEEGLVVGWKYLERNHNPAEKDAFGRTKRSSAKAGKVEDKEYLGCWVVRTKLSGVQFEVGTGMTDAQRRAYIEAGPDSYIGQHVTFKYQKLSPTGTPLFPVYKGFRAKGLDF